MPDASNSLKSFSITVAAAATTTTTTTTTTIATTTIASVGAGVATSCLALLSGFDTCRASNATQQLKTPPSGEAKDRQFVGIFSDRITANRK